MDAALGHDSYLDRVPRRIRLAMKCRDVDDFAALSNYHMCSNINIVYQKCMTRSCLRRIHPSLCTA
jgi:hypothetical protein